MIIQFIIPVAGFSLLYYLLIVTVVPFMTIVEKPKLWQIL